MKKFVFKIVAAVLICLLCLGLVEGLFTGLAWFQYQTVGVDELNDADLGNSFVADADLGGGYAATLQPHPYLGSVLNSNWPTVNNIGTDGIDFPFVRDPEYFSIMFTGGSVSSMLASSGHLERSLEKYDFGRPARILNGAGGGWHQPNPFIITGLYGDVADAVVTLDGFNEKGRFVWQKNLRRLEAGDNRFLQLNPLVAGNYDALGASWECNRLRRFSRQTNSRAVFYLTKFLRQRIENSVAPRAEFANRIWEVPDDWTLEQTSRFNLSQYRKYLGLVDAIADKLGIRVAHFIQPCPAIGKVLTPEERRIAGSLEYGPTYQKLADELPAISLLDCFDDVTETVYNDYIHNNDFGKQIMADRIADELAGLWKIPPASVTAQNDQN